MRNHEFWERTRCENLRCEVFLKFWLQLMHMTFIWHYDACSRQVAWWMVALGSSTTAASAATSSQGTLWNPWRGTPGTRRDTGKQVSEHLGLKIDINKSFRRGNPLIVESNPENLAAQKFRWPFVCQASLRFWVNGEEKAHSFPAFSWAKGDLAVSKSTRMLKRHEEPNIAKWSAVFTVYGIGGDFGAISSDHKLGWIFAISPGSRWHQDWLWRGTRKKRRKTLKTLEIVKGIVDPPHHFTRRLKTKWTWQVVQFQCFISAWYLQSWMTSNVVVTEWRLIKRTSCAGWLWRMHGAPPCSWRETTTGQCMHGQCSPPTPALVSWLQIPCPVFSVFCNWKAARYFSPIIIVSISFPGLVPYNSPPKDERLGGDYNWEAGHSKSSTSDSSCFCEA